MNIALDEQIKLLSKQLKIPTFADYQNIRNHADPNSTFGKLLLLLMRAEYEQRQQNNNRRRLKQANFPFTKTIDELDLSRYDGRISDLFVSEFASCRFIDEKKNLVMIGNPGREKNHMAIGIGLKACASGKVDLLIIDEMGYVSFDRFQSELLFKVIADRSERVCTIVTINLAFSEWTNLFENTVMVAALVDRLTFKSYILDMNGDSYRLNYSKNGA